MPARAKILNFSQKFYELGFKNEFRAIIKISIPLIFINLSTFLLNIVSQIFCGHIGKNELDAVSLANTVINILALANVIGFSSAADTFFPQVFASQNKKQVGVILQKGLLITFIASFPSIALLVNTYNIVSILNMDKEISLLVERFILIYIPSIWFVGLSTMLNKYIQSQGIVHPILVINLVINVFNAGFHALFIYGFNLGLTGAAISVSLSNFLNAVFLLLYIYFSKMYAVTWDGWSWKCLEDWKPYMKLSIPGFIMLIMEWLTFEIGAFIAATLGTNELGAQSICQQLSITAFMIPLSFAISGNIQIGQYLGSNQPDKAKNAAKVVLTMSTTTAVVTALLLFTLSSEIPLAFSNDKDIRKLATTSIRLIAFLHLFDSTQGNFGGIIRAIGGQMYGSIMNIIAFYVIGLPISISLMLKTSLTILGFWIGIIVGSGSLVLMQIFYALRIDWKKEALKALERSGSGVNEDKAYEDLDEGEKKIKEVFKSEEFLLNSKEPVTNLKVLAFKRLVVLFLMFLIFGLSFLTKDIVKNREANLLALNTTQIEFKSSTKSFSMI